MNKYRVVIISPEGNPHSAAFGELAIALVDSICQNGFSCDLKRNELSPDATNVILGFHLLSPNSIPAGIRYIVYQLEQLSESEGIMIHRPQVLEILAKADAVWDYSMENVAFLANKGIHADLIPVGYSPALTTIPNSPKDIDILFYGSRNDRRTVVLQELLNRGYNVKALFGLYGEERDLWISRAALVINVHYYEANLFESVRNSYLLNNGVPVLSEISPTFPWNTVPLEMTSYADLPDRAEQLLSDRIALATYGESCKTALAQGYAMKNLVAPFLI